MKNGDVHKIKMLSYTIFDTFEKCNRGDGNIVKNGGCFHNYRNKLFSDKPIFRFRSSHFVFIFVVLSCFDCAICLVSGMATKWAMALLKVTHHILVRSHQAELFSNKIFSLYSVLQIVLFMVLFKFFLKLGTLLQFLVLQIYII